MLLVELIFAGHGERAYVRRGGLITTGIVAMMLRRWSWTPAHLLSACLGAVAGHTVFGLVANAETIEDRIFLGVLAAVTVAVAWRARPAGVAWRARPAGAEGRHRPAGGAPVKPEPAAAEGQERCSTSPSGRGRS